MMSDYEYPNGVKTLIDMYDPDSESHSISRVEKMGTDLSLEASFEKLLNAGFFHESDFPYTEDISDIKNQNWFRTYQCETRNVPILEIWVWVKGDNYDDFYKTQALLEMVDWDQQPLTPVKQKTQPKSKKNKKHQR
jgi:hypothetical protein